MEETRKPRLRQVDRSIVVPAIVIDELVGPDHPVRAIWEYVGVLDLRPLLADIRAVEGTPGRNATDPRILVALWMWATSDGIGSARAVEKLCREHNAYRWLCGGVSLNHHTLSSFRSSNEEVLDGFLAAHVSALLHEGLIELSCVAQDGMRTRAGAGAGSFRRASSIEECRKLVEEQIAELKRREGEPLDAVAKRQLAAQKRHAEERAERMKAAKEAAEEVEAKRKERLRTRPKEAQTRGGEEGRGSTTDPEARKMKMADGGTRPGYNVQCVTTVGSKVVVAVDVTNQGSDGGLLDPMLDRVGKTYGRKPKSALVDGGFGSKADVESLHGKGIAVYTPLKGEKKELAAGKDPYAPKKGDKAGMKALRARMKTAEAKELYKKRGETAEWVFAGMRQRGLSQFVVRGLSKVRAVALLHALVHNLWQTIRLLDAKTPSWNWTEILRAGKGIPQTA